MAAREPLPVLKGVTAEGFGISARSSGPSRRPSLAQIKEHPVLTWIPIGSIRISLVCGICVAHGERRGFQMNPSSWRLLVTLAGVFFTPLLPQTRHPSVTFIGLTLIQAEGASGAPPGLASCSAVLLLVLEIQQQISEFLLPVAPKSNRTRNISLPGIHLSSRSSLWINTG